MDQGRMLRAVIGLFVIPTLYAGGLYAQSPAASAPAKAAASPAAGSPSPGPAAAAKPSPSPAPSATPGVQELINSLQPNDLQAAISLLKSNFAKPDAINETELSRATLEGLLVRLGRGVTILPEKPSASVEPAAPLYAEVLGGHVGYLRPGTLNSANLQALDKKLVEFNTGNKVDALVIDLRTSSGNDFGVAAEYAKRFVAKGKEMFALRKQGKQDRAFRSDRDPAYQGLMVLLVDGDTAGGAEAVAAALRFHNKALLIGHSTAGGAMEYSDLPLPGGKILRVAVSEAVSPEGKPLYPDAVKPDLPVEMAAMEKRQIFQLSGEKGMATFVYEAERPHLNEAALIAGTNPELETAEQRRNRAQDRAFPKDAVLQRALDVVTSVEIYSKR